MSELVIRKATLKDVLALSALGQVMHQESQYSKYNYNKSKTQKSVESLINDSAGIAFVAEINNKIIGGILGYITPHFFGYDLVAMDLALFVLPTERKGRAGITLIKAFIEEAKRLGATQICLANSTGVERDRVKTIYEYLGFDHVGYVYQMKGV